MHAHSTMITRNTTTTKTDDREQWLARIQRALTELQGDIPGLDACGHPADDDASDGSSSSAST